MVPLHPAEEPSRDQPLFRHLARVLPGRGVAVLRLDRRPAPRGRDVPFEDQAADALAAVRALRSEPRVGDAPIGLWGYSQGTWAAALAASQAPEEIAFLALVASPAVSPAAQMRYGTAEQLRRAGFDEGALTELAQLRATYEGMLRRDVDRSAAQMVVDRLADQPWFPLAYVPPELPAPGSWWNMDFDPIPILERVRCPVLLVYGDDDEWVPVEASIAGWRLAADASGADLSVVLLTGSGHAPTRLRSDGEEEVDPRYEERLLSWFANRFG